jgi:hypothetical protein
LAICLVVSAATADGSLDGYYALRRMWIATGDGDGSSSLPAHGRLKYHTPSPWWPPLKDVAADDATLMKGVSPVHTLRKAAEADHRLHAQQAL